MVWLEGCRPKGGRFEAFPMQLYLILHPGTKQYMFACHFYFIRTSSSKSAVLDRAKYQVCYFMIETNQRKCGTGTKKCQKFQSVAQNYTHLLHLSQALL